MTNTKEKITILRLITSTQLSVITMISHIRLIILFLLQQTNPRIMFEWLEFAGNYANLVVRNFKLFIKVSFFRLCS